MSPPTTLHALWCVVAGGALLLPNVAAVVIPFEHWPYTCAPMFAASPVSNALYVPHFILEKRDGTTAELPTSAVAGTSEWHFKRQFLNLAWGSDDPATSYGHVVDDTPALRAARIERFSAALVEFARRKKRPVFRDVRALRIELQQTHPVSETRVLGRYVLAQRRFVVDGGAP